MVNSIKFSSNISTVSFEYQSGRKQSFLAGIYSQKKKKNTDYKYKGGKTELHLAFSLHRSGEPSKFQNDIFSSHYNMHNPLTKS